MNQRETVDIPDFARRLGISRGFAYAEAKRTGHLAGVPVIRVGSRMVLPLAQAERVLRGEPVA